VLAERLSAQAKLLPEQDAAGVGQLISSLGSQGGPARAALLEALRSPSYDQLLDSLVSIARQPPIAGEPPGLAGRPAAELVPGLIRPPWRRLKRVAQALGQHSPDTEWHAVRIRAKHCRYAADALAPVSARGARRFAAAMATIQDILGEHQDTVVAEAWLRKATAAIPAACVAAGELIAAERQERDNLRSQWPAVWKQASAKKLRRWF
jgi:CHAD domain-containing protein